MLKKLVFSLIWVCFVGAQSEECLEVSHTWFKPVINENNEEVLLELDMSFGFIYSDGIHIYIMVKDKVSGELIQMVFDNGQYFDADNSLLYKKDADQKQKEKEKQRGNSENFEEYLKSLGKGQLIQKINRE